MNNIENGGNGYNFDELFTQRSPDEKSRVQESVAEIKELWEASDRINKNGQQALLEIWETIATGIRGLWGNKD